MVSHLKMTSPRLKLKVADFFEKTEGRTPIFLPVKVFLGVVRKYTERKQTSCCARVRSPLGSDWCQKTCVFLAPIRSQNGGDRLELVW